VVADEASDLDVVKVRVMNDKERRYKGVVDCVRQITAHEGILGFYKGFGMCWARVSFAFFKMKITHILTVYGQLGAHTVLTFVAFERLRSLFGIAPM
jgi:hypothetical protein